MADGQVNVRFSVQDAEVVKAALEKLGTDGQSALNKLSAAGAAPSRDLLALSAVMDDLKVRAESSTGSLGTLGAGLLAMGPAGIAAGVAIAALGFAIKTVIGQADVFAAWAQQVKDLSDTTGFSTTEIQAFDTAGAKVGLTAEKVGQDLERFTKQLEQVRQSTGPLYLQIEQINASLARQMAAARDPVTAWNLLTQAYAQAQTQAQKVALAVQVFGKGGAGSGLLLGQGDVGVLVAGLNQASVITDEQIKGVKELKVEIDATAEEAKRNFGSMFAPSLEGERQFYAGLLEISEWFKTVVPPGWMTNLLGGPNAAEQALIDENKKNNWGSDASSGGPARITVHPNAAPAGPDKDAIISQYNNLARMMSILGPAATATDQLNLEQAKLNKENAEAGFQYGGLIPKVMQYYEVQQNGAKLQVQVQNGTAMAIDLYIQKQNELQELVEHGTLTQDQANASLQIYADKTLPDVMNKQAQFKSAFPNLTKLGQDASNLSMQLDSSLSTALQGTTTDMIAMLRGTETLGVGLTNLANNMANAIAQAVLMKTVVGPIANSLAGFLGGGFGGGSGTNISGTVPGDSVTLNALGNVFDRGSITPFAMGGIVSGETYFNMGKMGEKGPEAIMPLQRGADGSLGVGGMAPNVNVNVYVQNNTSSDVQVQQQTNDSGGTDIVVTVNQISNQLISKGAFDNSLNARYGLKPGTIRR